jgi:hypothetical protein
MNFHFSGRDKLASRLATNIARTVIMFCALAQGCTVHGDSIKIQENPLPKQWLTVELDKPQDITLKIGIQYSGNADQCGKYLSDHYFEGAGKHSPGTVDWTIFGAQDNKLTVRLPMDKYTPEQCGMRSVAVVVANWDPKYQTEDRSSSTEFAIAEAGMPSWEREIECKQHVFPRGPQLLCLEKTTHTFICRAMVRS